MHIVIGTETYQKEVKMLSRTEQEIINKLPSKLAENPYQGDPLSYKFLREKKIKGIRVYFLVYEDLKLVLLIAISSKKDQQATIDHIVKYFDEYGLYLEKQLKS